MTALHYIVFLIFLVYLLYRWQNERQEKEEIKDEEQEKTKDNQLSVMAKADNNMGTRDLFLDVLKKIGCQFQLGEGDDKDRIYFAYQGEHFIADSSNEIPFVHIWDTHWEHVELYDIEEVSRMKRAINSSNMKTAVSTVYTIDEVGKNMDVHSKATILFIPQIPQLENYLRAELNDFFRAHQYVGNELMKLREKEKSL